MKLNFFSLETMFKRIFRYLLKRYFGQYLVDFSQDELTYNLSHGKGSVENIQLNVEALNDLSEEYNLPFEFLHGSIDFVSILVPWTSLLCENTVIDVKGLKLVVQPKGRPQDVSMFDSMWGSMASSLQLAEDCLNSNEDEEEIDVTDRSEGLEKIAKTIDAVLANMKIRFQETSLKIEYILPNRSTGISLEIKVATGEYFDEAGVNIPLSGHTHESEKHSYEPSAYSVKQVLFEGVSLFTAEFKSEQKPFNPMQPMFTMGGMDPSQFVPGSPEMPPTHTSLNVKKMEPNLNSDPILISKLSGQQKLRLKLKQNEAVVGPKVDVEFNFGAFSLFLTPQQVHLLFILVNGLIKPNNFDCDQSKKAQMSVANKPMRPADYEELLRQQISPDVMPHSLKNQQGWSSHSLDQSDEDFHLMTMENKVSYDTIPSTSSQDDLLSSMNSDIKADFIGIPHGQKTKSRGSSVQAILTDPLSELTHFHGCLSHLLVIILHDDSVQETITSDVGSDNVGLKIQAETYFTDLLNLQMSGLNFKDFASVRQPISNLCKTNHLRVMASGIVLDGNETSSSVERILKFNVSFHQLEILECLFNSPPPAKGNQSSKYMHLLTFIEKDDSSPEKSEVCCKLSYSQVECTSQNRVGKPPANKLNIEFRNMMCDIDISLTDRIRTLLNFSNFCNHNDSKQDHWNTDFCGGTQASSETEVTVSSSCLTINLRFPVPDLRSVHDRERAPWWQQNIHDEILVLVLQKIKFKTTFDSDAKFAEYEILCQDIHGLLKLSSSEEAISFLRVSVDPDVDEISLNNGFGWPRLVIRRMTKIVSTDFEHASDDTEDMHSCSLSYTLMANLNNDPSPFCSTSVVHDIKEANANFSSNHDEVIKPSDKLNMLNFIEQTVNKSECVFQFTIPTVNIIFPDKCFFELLCNRISSDLLLWEKTSLSSTNTHDSCGFKVHIPGLDVSFPNEQNCNQFSSFHPFHNDSNSDSEDEETSHMTMHDYYEKQRQKHKKSNNAGFTKFSLSFAITKGSLLINTPLLDDCNEPDPNQCGRLRLHIEEGSIFIASSYKGDENESYVCLLSEKSALYHEGSNIVEKNHSIVQPLTSSIRNNLKCIIYESDPGMHLNSAYIDSSNKEMLKLSVHIVRNPKEQIKTFKIAIEITEATLHHYMLPSAQMWIHQMIDFLKIDVFPVNGYVPPAVVTELHLNLNDCSIDYRPFRLPYRTALTVENFNMSCNVTATTPSFNFRIISEELRMFISNNIEVKNVDLRKYYVCVIDTGLIDISIKTSVDEQTNPMLQMSISNNKIHIRTCADSFKALLDLINYLSTNGDMDTNLNVPQENENLNNCTKSKILDSDSENLNMLMAEAMKECTIGVNGNNEEYSKNNSDFEYCNTDDEFCILEDDPGVGLIPRNGEPQIRLLTDEPIKIIENHFSVPPGKSDVLKAPKGYPPALFLVKVQEMSLIWHLYGGSDFQKGNPKKFSGDVKSDNNYKSKHGVTFADQQSTDNIPVSFCKVTPMPQNLDSSVVHFSMDYVTINQNRRTYTESWLQRGGSGRNHDVLMELQMNKVQFQREVYGLDKEYASRYILLINDIEIRDRLAVSQINKFLYQYATKDIPRQAHANMIDVKAVYSRPDPKRNSEECTLKVSCKPLRLNVDQDSLMFLVDFFQEVLEIPLIKDCEDAEGDEEKVHSSNINLTSNINMPENVSYRSQTFYRFFSFAPDVLIRIDYHGKRVQMEQGALKGLILGLGQLNASEIKLKRLCYRHGLLGHEKLISYALNEWQQDILKNQLPSLLGGVGPIHSFVQMFQGIKDLFYLPVMQYQRDGQIVRGLQKGASSFSTSTVIAVLDLSSRFFYAVQGTAQVAYDMVSPGPRISGKYQRSQEKYRKNSQPADIIEGVATAYNVVKEGLEDTARTIYRVASTEHEHKGVPGAVGGVIRQIPPSLFKPIIVGSEATTVFLDGVRYQLKPDAHQEDIHKWRTNN